MSKYLRKFETSAAYTAAESTLVKPNVSYIVETNGVEFKPIPPMNIITYEASAKLAEATSTYGSGLHTNAFRGKSGQLTIISHTFENSVGTIEFDDDVTSIGTYAFLECKGLTSVTIPNGITSIGQSAFRYCEGLTSITIPDSVTTIGNEAFQNCRGVTSVTIGSGVTSIGTGAFTGCTGLASIVVDSANTVYDSRNNCNAIINTSTNELIAGYKNTVIPDTVTSIGQSAFLNCYGLTSITIPNSVTSIGNNAFGGCSGLTSITIGSGVTSIGNEAFGYCSKLTSVTIGSGVTSIGNNTFSGCSGLTNITCNATTAPTIKYMTFYDVKTNGTLTVPSGSTGYDVWMGTGNYYLGKYSWTKVEQ